MAAAEAKAHGDQRLLTQVLPELNQPNGQELPVFWIASRSLLGLLTQVLPEPLKTRGQLQIDALSA
jgi:hypothetical protein